MLKFNPLLGQKPPVILSYGVAVLSVIAALIILWWMETVFHSAPHVSLLLCAVMFSAWFGGVRPGLLALALSVLAFKYYFLPPIYSWAVETTQLPRLLLFALSAFFVWLLSAAQRSAAESLRRARDDLQRNYEALQAENIERKRAEEALREAQAELAHVTRVMTMGALTASIAHEVNQPLAAVVTNGNAGLRWLAGDPPALDEARECLKRIIRDANRASEVIARIRSLVKKSAPAKARLDLNETIQEVLLVTNAEARRHRVLVRTELAAALPPVRGDRVQLQQVILNLVMNGIDAMKEVTDRPRELLIKSRPEVSGRVLVAVQDSGIGLDEQSLARVFEAFYTTKPEGMGLGLSISRSIIEAHGGRLWPAANGGHGTTFHFTLSTEDGSRQV